MHLYRQLDMNPREGSAPLPGAASGAVSQGGVAGFLAPPAALPGVNALNPATFGALRAGRFPSGQLPLLLRELTRQSLLASAVSRALASLIPAPDALAAGVPVAALNAHKGARVSALLEPLVLGLLALAEHDLAYGQPPAASLPLDAALHLHRGGLPHPSPDPYAAFDRLLRFIRLDAAGVQRKTDLYTGAAGALGGYAALRELAYRASVARVRFVAPARFTAAVVTHVFDDMLLASLVATPCLSATQAAADGVHIAALLNGRLEALGRDAAHLLNLPHPEPPADSRRRAATERNIALNARIGGQPGWIAPHGGVRFLVVARGAVQIARRAGGGLRVTAPDGDVQDIPAAPGRPGADGPGHVDVVQFPSVRRVVVAVWADAGLLATRDVESGGWNAPADLDDLGGVEAARWNAPVLLPDHGGTPAEPAGVPWVPGTLDAGLLDILARVSLVCGVGAVSLADAAEHLHRPLPDLQACLAAIDDHARQRGRPAPVRVDGGFVSCLI